MISSFVWHSCEEQHPDLVLLPSLRGLGVSHVDETLHLLSSKIPFLGGADDLAMSRAMVDMWANFAAVGEPTPEGGQGPAGLEHHWEPAERGKELECVYLENGRLHKQQDEAFHKRLLFWRELLDE